MYLGHSGIDIFTLMVVDDEPRIELVVRNIAVHEDDYVLILEPTSLEQQVSMADIGLVSVVTKSSRPSNTN